MSKSKKQDLTPQCDPTTDDFSACSLILMIHFNRPNQGVNEYWATPLLGWGKSAS